MKEIWASQIMLSNKVTNFQKLFFKFVLKQIYVLYIDNAQYWMYIESWENTYTKYLYYIDSYMDKKIL